MAINIRAEASAVRRSPHGMRSPHALTLAGASNLYKKRGGYSEQESVNIPGFAGLWFQWPRVRIPPPTP
jgi:hypothetical protein